MSFSIINSFLGSGRIFKDIRNENNFHKLVKDSLKNKSPNFWGYNKTEGDGRKMSRLLSQKELTVKVINSKILNKDRVKLSKMDSNYIILDGSEMRKPSSEKMENLMKVRALKGGYINGYRTLSGILINNNKKPSLLATIPYSSKADDFKSENTIAFDLIKNINDSVERNNGIITYLLDSNYDNQKFFDKIESYGDKYIIRAQYLKRNVIDNRGKTRYLKDLKYRSIGAVEYETLFVSGRKHKNIKAKFSYANFTLNNIKMTSVNVKLLKGNGSSLFKKDFYLITNITYSRASKNRIMKIYNAYGYRWKIELVFKFLKSNLGWEKFRLKDYEANKKMIALLFMIAAYLYDVGKVKIDLKVIEMLAYMGAGKGKITEFYITRGLKTFISMNETIRYLKENYTEEEIDEIHKELEEQRRF